MKQKVKFTRTYNCRQCECSFSEFTKTKEVRGDSSKRNYELQLEADYPCPTCGYRYQLFPKRKRHKSHLQLTGSIGCTWLFTYLCFIFLSNPYSLYQHYLLMILSVVFLAFAMPLHVLIEVVFYRNRSKSITMAEEAIRSGDLEIRRAGNPDLPIEPRSDRCKTGLILLFGCIVTFLPLLIVPGNGWPSNPDVTGFEMPSPGAHLVIGMNSTVTSIDRIYGYQGTVEHLNAEQCGQHFDAVVILKRIGDKNGEIKIGNSKPGRLRTGPVSVTIQLPNNPELFDQTIEYRIRAKVEFPVWSDDRTYDVNILQTEKDIRIQMPPRDVSMRFVYVTKISVGIAFLIYMLASYLLITGNRSDVAPLLPTEVNATYPD